MENNQAFITGRIASGFTYDHESYGEKFYSFLVEVERSSGKTDLIPVIISELLRNVRENYTDDYICLRGQFRQHNKHEDNKSKVVLYVFVLAAELLGRSTCTNDVFLEGYICKTPVYRETPLGRQITDLVVAVSRAYGKCDYIPCICWGRLAYGAGSMPVGACVRVAGRIQSREYKKAGETKVAYELSVNLMERVS